MTDYDSPWKEALDAYFEPFLAFFFAALHAEIDWSRGYEPLDKEFQQIVREGELGRRLVDKLVKVWLKDGREQWILIHVEVQTTEEGDFARRMYVYNYRIFDRYNEEVVSLAVLGDDNPHWRPDSFGYGRAGFHSGIQFPVAKLLDYAEQTEALEESQNPFATVVLAHLKTLQTRGNQGERRNWKVRLIKRLYDRGWAADGGAAIVPSDRLDDGSADALGSHLLERDQAIRGGKAHAIHRRHRNVSGGKRGCARAESRASKWPWNSDLGKRDFGSCPRYEGSRTNSNLMPFSARSARSPLPKTCAVFGRADRRIIPPALACSDRKSSQLSPCRAGEVPVVSTEGKRLVGPCGTVLRGAA